MNKNAATTVAILGIALLALCSPPAVHAGEWPAWRGPYQSGASDDTGLVSDWSPEGKNLVWSADFTGRSTPVVFNGQTCVIGRVGEDKQRQEIVACFDAETGRKNWEHRYNVYNTTVPFNRLGWASLVGDPETGNVYAHGAAGQLTAYSAAGDIVWSHFTGEAVGRLSGYGGRTQTPLIDRNQLIITFVSNGWGKLAGPSHRYFSFDKRTGEQLWISKPGARPFDMNTQGGSVIADIGGRHLLISSNADGHIYALKANTGEKVWEFNLSKRGINVTPVVANDTVYISHSEENLDDAVMGRFVAIDATGEGDVTAGAEKWRINETSAGFPSPAYKDGKLYVIDNSANLKRIDAATGAIEWEYSVGTVGKASPVLADGKIFVAETNGRFQILEDGDDGPKPLSFNELKSEGDRYAEIYGSAAIAYGRIYLSTEGRLYCIGDKSKKIDFAAHRPRPAPAIPSAKGAPHWIQVVPAHGITAPGETVRFEARAFDPVGNPLGVVEADWKVEGLKGAIDANGRFNAGKSMDFQAGTVVATFKGKSGESLIRVAPPLPWVEDFESYPVGSAPPHWVSARGRYEVQEKDGNKVLVKKFYPRGLMRTWLYMGPSNDNYTIEADVMGSAKKRRRSDVGLLAGGYTLDLMGNQQKVQVRSWASEERMAQEVEFEWEPDVWYRMKMRVEVGEKKARIRGKVWPKDQNEPAEWTIEVEDPLPIHGGSPGLIGYSPEDVYYDNVKVTVN